MMWRDVCFWHLADKPPVPEFVAYWTNNGQKAALGLDLWAANDPLADIPTAYTRTGACRYNPTTPHNPECGPQRYGEVTMTKADEDAIRDIELRFNEAWGRHDADGMVESLADDAQFVTVNGAWTKTRAEYLDLMQRLHGANGPFRLSTRETPEMHVR